MRKIHIKSERNGVWEGSNPKRKEWPLPRATLRGGGGVEKKWGGLGGSTPSVIRGI